MSDQLQLLSEKEAAALLRVAPGTLRVRRCTGQRPGGMKVVPCVRIGRAVRYRRVDIERYILEHLQGAGA